MELNVPPNTSFYLFMYCLGKISKAKLSIKYIIFSLISSKGNFKRHFDICSLKTFEAALLIEMYFYSSQKKVISSALDWLAKQANKDVSFMFYHIDFLFQQLVGNHPSDTENKLSLGAAEAYLTRDVYLYMASTSCS